MSDSKKYNHIPTSLKKYFPMMSLILVLVSSVGYGILLLSGDAKLYENSVLKMFTDVGQAFGLLNTLFSGFAFVAVYWTFATQREQLEEQKKQSRALNIESEVKFLKELSRQLLEDGDSLSSFFEQLAKEIPARKTRFERGQRINSSDNIQQSFCEAREINGHMLSTVVARRSCRGASAVTKDEMNALKVQDEDALNKLLADFEVYQTSLLQPWIPSQTEIKDISNMILNANDLIKLRAYFLLLGFFIESFLRNQPFEFHMINYVFDDWQHRLKPEQIHGIFFCIFHLDKEEQLKLQELIIKSPLFDYFYEKQGKEDDLPVLGKQQDYPPFNEAWFLERKPSLKHS
jgi:hypothetical protein